MIRSLTLTFGEMENTAKPCSVTVSINKQACSLARGICPQDVTFFFSFLPSYSGPGTMPGAEGGGLASFSPPPREADALVATMPPRRKWRLRAQRQRVKKPEEWENCKGTKAMAGSEGVRKGDREGLGEEVTMHNA